MNTRLNICVVGSGTAGLISALLLRKAFPTCFLTVISSPDVGIVGVGEGSTEHWSLFMKIVGLTPLELIDKTDATLKSGIRFENWTEHTPTYFHSIRGQSNKNDFDFPMTYAGMVDQGRLASDVTRVYGLDDGFVSGNNTFYSVNQFHFDTFKLNAFFRDFATIQGIHFVDSNVTGIKRDPNSGNITQIELADHTDIDVDFVVDATGFKRVIMSGLLGNTAWTSFSDYLLVDSAIAGPCEHEDPNVLLPFTRAIAQDSGWIWRIPTQKRMGNGYVYSSHFCSDEEAKDRLIDVAQVDVLRSRSFRFDPGYNPRAWLFNCCAVGLSSSFVEPLEATNIATAINQSLLLVHHLAGYNGDTSVATSYNKQFRLIMENILDMIRLHYISDRNDSAFWLACQSAAVPTSLREKLDAWKHRPPMPYDFESPYMLFKAEHFFHVAQGQGLLGTNWARSSIDRFNQRFMVEKDIDTLLLNRVGESRKLHAEAIREVLEVKNNPSLRGDSQTG